MNSDYCVAVHAMVYLNHHRTVCSSGQLAQNICTHPARVRRILARLCQKQLLTAEPKGPRGGYRFTGQGSQVSLADIAAALDISFAEANWHSGDSSMDCLIASGMSSLMDEVFMDLNQCCYARLKKITIADLDNRLFGDQTAGQRKEKKK